MSEPAISVKNLGKSYRLGIRYKSSETFMELLTGIASAPFNRLKKLREHHAEAEDAFWALKDVSFDIQPGEVVGIIGRNGAGKSTLLKILSRITEPTIGEVHLRGRVSSLLEVGTGFHQELTGRENIFLNGSILGMKKSEIEGKFEEIVAFAEVEKFLDTPVKRYSSGMHVRLAFAVAAHLEPEILIVDEVLAVGDYEFQKKCLGKMEEVSIRDGRTILFVSHNLAAVRVLCSRALLLEGGTCTFDGDTPATISEYMRKNKKDNRLSDISKRMDRGGDGSVKVIKLDVVNSVNTDLPIVVGDAVKILIEFEQAIERPRVIFAIYNETGSLLSDFDLYERVDDIYASTKVVKKINCIIESLTIIPGLYYINIAILNKNGELLDHVESGCELEILGGIYSGVVLTNSSRGYCTMPHNWEISS